MAVFLVDEIDNYFINKLDLKLLYKLKTTSKYYNNNTYVEYKISNNIINKTTNITNVIEQYVEYNLLNACKLFYSKNKRSNIIKQIDWQKIANICCKKNRLNFLKWIINVIELRTSHIYLSITKNSFDVLNYLINNTNILDISNILMLIINLKKYDLFEKVISSIADTDNEINLSKSFDKIINKILTINDLDITISLLNTFIENSNICILRNIFDIIIEQHKLLLFEELFNYMLINEIRCEKYKLFSYIVNTIINHDSVSFINIVLKDNKISFINNILKQYNGNINKVYKYILKKSHIESKIFKFIDKKIDQ